MSYIIYVLAAAGFWYVVGAATISDVPREKLSAWKPVGFIIAKLLECAGCWGIWTGLAASLFGVFSVSAPHIPAWIVTALFTCTTNLVIARLIGA